VWITGAYWSMDKEKEGPADLMACLKSNFIGLVNE
jgi:hypothetical protein